jgi:hypothetical protein
MADEWDTPYDSDIAELADELDLPIDTIRDRFILLALDKGDPGPLCCFLIRGYVPGLAVRQRIGLMIAPEEALKQLHKRPPYRFEIKSPKRGPHNSTFNKMIRDRKLAKYVANLVAMWGPGTYDAAIKTVANHTGFGQQTVRDAYDAGKRSSK